MVNRVILIGRLGDSPKNNNTGKGTAVSNFRLAVEDTWKNKKEGLQRNTEWVRCVAWGKLADTVANYLDKGDTGMDGQQAGHPLRHRSSPEVHEDADY